MKYMGTLITVSDIGRSRRFYESLFGLEVFQDYGKCVGFSCGLSLMQDFGELAGIPDDEVIKGMNSTELYFEEDDMDGFLKKLKACPKIKYLHEVREYPWGQRVIRFYDPDDNLIEVGEDMRMVVKRFISSGMSEEETAKRMNISLGDLGRLLNG